MIPTDKPSTTVPQNFQVSVVGLSDEARARAFGQRLGDWLVALGTQMDLSSLDGATAAVDYSAALTGIDRGFAATRALEPTREGAIGVAMAVPVLRNGCVNSHLVLDLNYVIWLEDTAAEGFANALHLLAHECAHVEVTAAYDRCFPGVMLRRTLTGVDGLTAGLAMACWDEFAATALCAGIGANPSDGYEATFLTALEDTRTKANEKILAYREHANVMQVVEEVVGLYGALLKFASYHAGNMSGRGLAIDDLPNTRAALCTSWFEPFFTRLQKACAAIGKDFGKWSDERCFEELSMVLLELVRDGGVNLSRLPDGGYHADIPFSIETMPRGWNSWIA